MEDNRQRSKHLTLSIICVIVLTVLDQLIKKIVTDNMKVGDRIVLVDGVFEIHYIRNTGSAWGVLSGKTFLLVLISIFVVGLIAFLYHNISFNRRYRIVRILLTFILGGAIGNMIDRIALKYVVDYLYFSLINFPVFNFADIFITVSIILVVILMIFKYNGNDFDVFIGDKKLAEDGTYVEKKNKKK